MTRKRKNNYRIRKIYRFLIYILPGILFFSYYPLMHFGENESMNFELSLPLLWLVIFNLLSSFMLIKRGLLFKNLKKDWAWLLFPVYLTLSLIWSHDVLRGILIDGIFLLIYFAVYSVVKLKDEIIDENFKRSFFKFFLITSVFICGWCLVQCILDVIGIGRDYTLLCSGCSYKTFGFPHPNGFAAEPQFMGNLLLAPIVVTLYLLNENKYFKRSKLLLILFVLIATLFLTLSRGAIYAFIVGMTFFVVVRTIRIKDWKSMSFFILIILAFLFTLNLQGIFAELSKTDDTYVSGIGKVVNQLSLGIIDVSGNQIKKGNLNENQELVEKNDVLNDEENSEIQIMEERESAIFDGYVEVSTNMRIAVWKGALKTWIKDWQTALFGVGIGGGLRAMYENGNFFSSREIINNQYISLLLEGGIVGIFLMILTIVLLFRLVCKNSGKLYVFTLILMYMVSICFFSGLPNALQVYLLPILIMQVCSGKS